MSLDPGKKGSGLRFRCIEPGKGNLIKAKKAASGQPVAASLFGMRQVCKKYAQYVHHTNESH